MVFLLFSLCKKCVCLDNLLLYMLCVCIVSVLQVLIHIQTDQTSNQGFAMVLNNHLVFGLEGSLKLWYLWGADKAKVTILCL